MAQRAFKREKQMKKWADLLIGIGFYFLWGFIVSKLNIFIAYLWSIPLYIGFFLLLLTWSIIRKNSASLCGLVVAALVPLIFNTPTGEGKLGTFLFFLALSYCLWQFFGEPFLPKPASKKKRGKSKEAQPVPTRWGLLGRAGILVFLFLLGARESDFIVSKLYFVPWPIYSDYTYPEGVQKVYFKSLDGTLLNGWYFHGQSPDAPKRPVLLYVHGNAGNMAAQFFQFNFLMDWGYDVFTFDYRGFGLSEGHPSREGLWKDTQAAFQEMTMLQPGRQYAVVGFSMGGPYAVQLAAHEPRLSAAAILTCFSSFREIGIYTLKNWGVPHWAAPLLGWLLIPEGLDAKVAELEPQIKAFMLATPSKKSDLYEDPDHVDILPPALFVQGTWDGNIPYDMTEKMASNYAGPHEFLPMPNYPHGDYFKGPLEEKFHDALDRLLAGKGKGI
jgi:pimeloyl-ACP methyl ester carboxylesterase